MTWGENGAVTSAIGLGWAGLLSHFCLGKQKDVDLGTEAAKQSVCRIAIVLDARSGVLAVV